MAGRRARKAMGVAIGAAVLAVLAPAPTTAEVRPLDLLDEVTEPLGSVLGGPELPHTVPPPRTVDPTVAQPPGPARAGLLPGIEPQGDLPFPSNQTFRLESKPGSARTIYLDFDGGTITGTAWNNDPTLGTGPSFATPPFDLDGNPSSFTTDERRVVQLVWQQVAEDYAPFDVNVTTRDLGPAAIDRSGPTDQQFGTVAMVTPAVDIAQRCRCSGQAYIGVFDWETNHGYYQPAFVYPHRVGNDAKDVAEVVSHEVGHTLGLDHDGHPDAAHPSYYEGHGVWGPIMGAVYHRPLSQLSKGEYPGATLGGHQVDPDDFAVMAANGAPRRDDDHGDTGAAATPLPGTGPFAAGGVITSDADVDVFRLTLPAGTLHLEARPAPVGPNLDIRLELRSGGEVLAADDPPVTLVDDETAAGLDAALSMEVPAGTYDVSVEGVGFGTPAEGYSGYGSVGAFSLTGSFTPAPGTEPEPPGCAGLDLVCLVQQLLASLDLAPIW